MIAVFGYGTVGKSLVTAAAKRAVEADVPIPQGPFVLVDPGKDLKPLPGEIARCSLAFICVPTPTEADGRQDLSMVFDSMRTLLKFGFDGLAVIRSTITPANVRMLQRIYPLRIATLPEFLTEANSAEDAYRADYYVVGAAGADQQALCGDFLHRLWPDSAYYYVSPPAAMLIKYWVNCCLASRVALANEFKLYWDAIGTGNWGHVSDGFKLDQRCGGTHMSVPGPDGKPGFGGKCFPKDVAAMAHEMAAYAEQYRGGVLDGALEVNVRARGKGRT